MIFLGKYDETIPGELLSAYREIVKLQTNLSVEEVAEGVDKLQFKSYAPDRKVEMTIAQVQKALSDIGFFPGGKVDGICGYRTRSAIRLFQEYVRTIEGLKSFPDGIFGPQAQGHLRRWLKEGLSPDWSEAVDNWRAQVPQDNEHARWLALLRKVKYHYLQHPSRVLQMVNARGDTGDTRKVVDWDFDPGHMHLLGIRRQEESGRFDDIFIFLIKGMVFKFQGSTEPGSSRHPRGAPFLVPGQHNFQFGWHRAQYLALRPLTFHEKGVLVVRSNDNLEWESEDLESGLEFNGSINIHWGGKGLSRHVNNWSEGCQVITSAMYANHHNDLIDCSAFSALNNRDVSNTKTRGAYNVLQDLAIALSGDMNTRTIKYMLLLEQDLALDPILEKGIQEARNKVDDHLD